MTSEREWVPLQLRFVDVVQFPSHFIHLFTTAICGQRLYSFHYEQMEFSFFLSRKCRDKTLMDHYYFEWIRGLSARLYRDSGTTTLNRISMRFLPTLSAQNERGFALRCKNVACCGLSLTWMRPNEAIFLHQFSFVFGCCCQRNKSCGGWIVFDAQN